MDLSLWNGFCWQCSCCWQSLVDDDIGSWVNCYDDNYGDNGGDNDDRDIQWWW